MSPQKSRCQRAAATGLGKLLITLACLRAPKTPDQTGDWRRVGNGLVARNALKTPLTMSLLVAARLSRAPAFGLAAVGVSWGGLAASWPDLKAAVDASDGEMGLALLCSAAGGLLAMAAAPKVSDRLGRFSMPVLCLVVAAALLVPLMAGTVPELAGALFMVGLALGGLDILTNVEVSAREARHDQHLMGFNHAMYSFAFAATALATGLARQSGLGPAEVMPMLSLACLALAGFSYLPADATMPADDPTTKDRHAPPTAAVVLTGTILFASFIGENATEAWSALHIERTLGAPAGDGGFGPAMLGLVMGIARLFGQVVAERVGHGRIIFGSAIVGMAGALIIASAGSKEIVLLGVAITALGMAVVVPSALTLLGGHVTEETRAKALSRAWMLGIAGFFIGPALMGGVAELFGLRVAFVFIAVIVAVILPAVWRLERTT